MAAASVEDLPAVDKISLNNEIVRLRPTAANAKINVIRKLVREIKVLKVLKDGLPEAIQKKKKAKAERLTEEMVVAKTLDKDVITISALIYSPSESLKISQDPTSTVKDKVLIKIARNKTLVSSVEKMLAKYQPISHKELETIVSSIGVKKKKKKPSLQTMLSDEEKESRYADRRDFPQDSGASAEESDGSEESDSGTVSRKRSKKAERPENLPEEMSDEIDSETQDVESDEMPAKRRKKEKRSKTLTEETSGKIETQDVESDEMSAKRRKKAKHKKNRDPGASSDEEDIELSKVDQVKVSSKKKRKSEAENSLEEEETNHEEEKRKKKKKKEQKKTEDLEAGDSSTSFDEMKVDSDTEEGNFLARKKEKSKSKKLNALYNSSHDEKQLNEEGGDSFLKRKPKHRKLEVDSEDFYDEEDDYKYHKSHKRSNWNYENASSDNSENDAGPPKPKKPVVLSTKAIRFADLLAMESESPQPNFCVDPQAPEGEKEVDGFFTSGDGRSDFITRVPEKVVVNQENRNKKYEEIRAQYLKEYGAVPSRTELRRLEREGKRGSKSFHNVAIKEYVRDTRPAAVEPRVEQPPRLVFRKAKFEDIPVHPSWEAKKKAKEQLVAPFQGKKIIFD